MSNKHEICALQYKSVPQIFSFQGRIHLAWCLGCWPQPAWLSCPVPSLFSIWCCSQAMHSVPALAAFFFFFSLPLEKYVSKYSLGTSSPLLNYKHVPATKQKQSVHTFPHIFSVWRIAVFWGIQLNLLCNWCFEFSSNLSLFEVF